MPNRVLRDWTDSDRVNLLSPQAEVFFLRLIMKVDDFGRFHASPKRLLSACYPLKDSIRDTDVSRWLTEVEKAGLVRCYDAAGCRYLCINRFNQRLRQMHEKYPRPPDDGHLTVNGLSNDSHMTAAFVSIPVSDSDSPNGKGGPGERGANVLPQLRAELAKYFNRKVNDRWNCEEEYLLVEACKRANPLEEWTEILGYYRQYGSHPRHSIRSLLEHWGEELDKSRTFKPEPTNTTEVESIAVRQLRQEVRRL